MYAKYLYFLQKQLGTGSIGTTCVRIAQLSIPHEDPSPGA